MTEMLVPRFDIAFRPWSSLFDTWVSPFASYVECESWMPASDVAETDNAFVVTMELPGIDMKKTDISYTEGVLTVRGEKTKESTEGECCHCSERYSGAFERSMRISGKVEVEKIDATYKDGVLKLTIPKSEESVPKKIEVR